MKHTSVFLVLLLSVFFSCKREEDVVPVQSTGTSTANVDPFACVVGFNSGLDLVTDIVGIVNYAGINGFYPSCANVNIDSIISSDQDTVEIDFGSSNCLDSDGHYRRGRIVCLYNGSFSDSLNMNEIFFYDYYVDDIKLNGNIQFTNNGHDGSGNTSYSILTTTTFEKNTGMLSFNSNLLYVRSIGESTSTILDDVWHITGVANNCTSYSGDSFSSSITSPVYRSEQCKWLTKGSVAVTPQGGSQVSLDYGNGGCDNAATYTVNGNSYSFVLD